MKELIGYLWKNHKKKSAILGMLGILASATSVFMNYSLKYAVDCIFHVDQKSGYRAVLLFCIMALTTYFSDQLGENYLVEKYRLYFIRDLRGKMMDVFLDTPFRAEEDKKLGMLMNRDSMAEKVGDIYRTLTYDLPYCVLESVGFLLFLSVTVSWKMNSVLLILLPFAVLLKRIGEELRRKNGDIWDITAESDHFFLDVTEKRDFVRANAYGMDLKKKYVEKNKKLFGVQKSLYAMSTLLSFLQFVLENSIRLLVPVFGAFMLYRGEITPGGVAVSTTIFSSFLVPSLFQGIEIYKEVKSSQEAVGRVMQAVKKQEQDADSRWQRKSMNENILISLQKVSFSFGHDEILCELDLELPRSGCIGICGLSGAGKSTLGKLISGLYEATGGKLIYNGCYFTDSDVSSRIAYMGPDAFFFEGTILQNMGNKTPVREEMQAFLKAHELAESRVLENNAENVSGGQKELLAFVRAVSKESVRLIVLDEPAASLDDSTKSVILEQIRRLSAQKCLVVISHQKEILGKMDCCYQLKNGRLKRCKEVEDEQKK